MKPHHYGIVFTILGGIVSFGPPCGPAPRFAHECNIKANNIGTNRKTVIKKYLFIIYYLLKPEQVLLLAYFEIDYHLSQILKFY